MVQSNVVSNAAAASVTPFKNTFSFKLVFVLEIMQDNKYSTKLNLCYVQLVVRIPSSSSPSGVWWSWYTTPSLWRSTAAASPTTHWTSSLCRITWWRRTTPEQLSSPPSSTPSQISATTSQRLCTKTTS